MKNKLDVKGLTPGQFKKLERLGQRQVMLHQSLQVVAQQIAKQNEVVVRALEDARYRDKVDRAYQRLYVEWAKLKRQSLFPGR